MARLRLVPPRHGHGNTNIDKKILVREGVCVQGGFRELLRGSPSFSPERCDSLGNFTQASITS